MNKSGFRMAVPLALMGVCFILAPAQGAEQDKNETRKKTPPSETPAKTLAKPAKPTGLSGAVTTSDPQTGQRRATAEEMPALQSQSRANSPTPTGPTPFVTSDGVHRMTVDSSKYIYSVVTRNPDGSLSFGEVVGESAVKRTMNSHASDGKKGESNVK